ncbi:MAG: ComF family protein, partial [candidate division KSB1 bacterium]|nr:ComF family protein [candidate division KSB1 bacterium]
ASDLLGLIYPPKCLICNRHQRSAQTALLCEDCLAEIAALPLPEEGWFDKLNVVPHDRGLDRAIAGWRYDAHMQQVIHAMKYQRRPSLSQVLGSMLAQRLASFLNEEHAHAVLVPVPLHRRRARERGFNQSLLLARALAKSWNLSVQPRAVQRIRFTKSQATLDATARWENVNGAFAPAPNLDLQGRLIFLIDDVFTTGATMNACASALKTAGTSRVIGIALAKAGFESVMPQSAVENGAQSS